MNTRIFQITIIFIIFRTRFDNMFVVGFHTREVRFFFVVQTVTKEKRISKKITYFDWIQWVTTTTRRNGGSGVARGNRKSQPAKVWSINTKYHVVLTNNTLVWAAYVIFWFKSSSCKWKRTWIFRTMKSLCKQQDIPIFFIVIVF